MFDCWRCCSLRCCFIYVGLRFGHAVPLILLAFCVVVVVFVRFLSRFDNS